MSDDLAPPPDDARASQWLASGMILHDGLAHLVTLHRSLPVTDVRAWALSSAWHHDEAALTATSGEARAQWQRIAAGLRQWAEGDHDCVESGIPLWALSPAIAVRAKMALLEVNKGNVVEYFKRLMAQAVPARPDVQPTFHFDANSKRPVICATPESPHMVNFAARGVEAHLISEDNLWYCFDQSLENHKLVHTGSGEKSNSATQARKEQRSGDPLSDDPPISALWAMWGARCRVTPEILAGRGLMQAIAYGVAPEGLEETASCTPTCSVPSPRNRPSRRVARKPGNPE